MAEPPGTLFKAVLADTLRLLSFGRPSPALAANPRAFLIFGLICTWLAGIGRYWDNPRAQLWQHLGLGSVAYVFCLALILWLVVWPLRPRQGSYERVLTFVTLTSPPALLYAIPVERFLTLSTAQSVNAVFLGVVATWRVALLFVFLRRAAGLSRVATVVAGLLPLVAIVVALVALNLEHVIFDLMAGIRPEDRTANDQAFFVVMITAYFSLLVAPVLLVAYLWLVTRARRKVPSGTTPP